MQKRESVAVGKPVIDEGAVETRGHEEVESVPIAIDFNHGDLQAVGNESMLHARPLTRVIVDD